MTCSYFSSECLVSIQQGVESQQSRMTEDASVYRRPHFLVPFACDPEFVQRSDIWAWMEEQHAGLARRMALVGVGGFGCVYSALYDRSMLILNRKSQLAIHFARYVHDKSPNTSIFWIYGASKATFEASYRRIAETLLLPRRADADVNLLALVRDWLQKVDASPFLMVIDNADSIDVYSGNAKNGEGLASYLPNCNHGKVLITTRNRDTAERLTGNGKWIRQIPVMEPDQALQLLQSRLGRNKEEESDARCLIRALDYIPLAISQAAAYIQRRSPRVTLRSYLVAFNKDQTQKQGLLRSDKGDLWRYEGVSNSVLVTWQVTFEQIRQERPSAANLLSLMSQFQAQNIPETMLHSYNKGTPGNASTDTKHESHEDRDCGNFEDDMDMLRGYSLVALVTDGFCEMHSLVQFCTQTWISEHGDPEWWRRLFTKLAATHFPVGTFETWALCQRLLPHIEKVLAEKAGEAEQPDVLDCRAELLTKVASYMLEIGEFSRGEVLGNEAVEIRKNILGIHHHSTLTAIDNLASAYRCQGRYDDAEKLFLQVIEISKMTVGEDDSITTKSMAHLALVYMYQRRWEEAEQLELQTIKTRKMMLGADNSDTLTSMANLASIYRAQGRLNEAEELFIQVIEGRKIKIGANHPDTLTSMGNLALTFWDQGQKNKAEKLLMQVTETRMMKLGAKHPSTLMSMYKLADIWYELGRLQEAISMMQMCVRIQQGKLGLDHPKTQSFVIILDEWTREASE